LKKFAGLHSGIQARKNLHTRTACPPQHIPISSRATYTPPRPVSSFQVRSIVFAWPSLHIPIPRPKF
jgi:hypothetical protein